jgi:hypothetical protein
VTAALCVLLAVAPLEPDVDALGAPDCVCTAQLQIVKQGFR